MKIQTPLSLDSITIHPLTPERWDDLETLFGARGACAGCWCMWWRIPRAQFVAQQGEGNRTALKALCAGPTPPGLVAYIDGVPAGWVSVGPRESYPALERSKSLPRLDDQPVWSIVCFFSDKKQRGRGLLAALIQAAVDYAAAHGARIVEAYPLEDNSTRQKPVLLYLGLDTTFKASGFVEAGRPGGERLVLRKYLAG